MKIKMSVSTSAFEVNVSPKAFPSSLAGQQIPSIIYDVEVDCSLSEFTGCFNAYAGFVKELVSSSTVLTPVPEPSLPEDSLLDKVLKEIYDKYKS